MLLLQNQTANDALALEKERMDVLLARQHNLISCVLQGEGAGGAPGRQNSMQHRTLGEIIIKLLLDSVHDI